MVLSLILSLIPTPGNILRIAALVVGMVYPTLESLKAVESKELGDDTQWLMYWVCYATLISLETIAWPVLYWIPFYRLFRVVGLAWLALPQFRGATLLYHDFVRPFLLVAVEKGKQLPALEPYLRGFAGSKGKNFEALKREAVAKVEESFEKAKQQAAVSADAEGEEPMAYQPLKAHAQ